MTDKVEIKIYEDVIRLGREFFDYHTRTKLSPAERHHACLTLWSTALSLERVFLHHVNTHVGLVDVRAAKGGVDEKEHNTNLVKIANMSFLKRLEDYNRKDDLGSIIKGRDFKERIVEGKGDIINKVIDGKTPLIANPGDWDLNMGSNGAVFDLYGHVPVFLVPIIGIDEKVYMIIGGSNWYSKREFGDVLGRSEDPKRIINEALQRDKAYEREHGYERVLHEIMEIEDSQRNPLMSMGGFANRINKAQNLKEAKEYASIIAKGCIDLEEGLKYLNARMNELKLHKLVYINDIIAQVAAESTCKHILNLKKSIPYVRADPDKLYTELSFLMDMLGSNNGDGPLKISTKEKTNRKMHLKGVYINLVSKHITNSGEELVSNIKKVLNNGEINRFKSCETELSNGGTIKVMKGGIQIYIPAENYSS